MVKVIVISILALVLLIYGAFFLAWNMAAQDIVVLRWFGGVQFSQELPVGALVFVGLAVGALLMIISCWSAWSGQRALAKRAVAQVQKAKEKLQAQLDAINELRTQVEQLEDELAACKAGNGTWGQVSAGDIAVPEVGPEAASGEAADDPEII